MVNTRKSVSIKKLADTLDRRAKEAIEEATPKPLSNSDFKPLAALCQERLEV